MGSPPSLAEHSKAPRLRHGDLCLDRLDDKSATRAVWPCHCSYFRRPQGLRRDSPDQGPKLNAQSSTLKAPIAPFFHCSSFLNGRANGVWSGRARVLEETNNETTKRKRSKVRDARAAGAASRVGRVGVSQCEVKRGREGWMDGWREWDF